MEKRSGGCICWANSGGAGVSVSCSSEKGCDLVKDNTVPCSICLLPSPPDMP